MSDPGRVLFTCFAMVCGAFLFGLIVAVLSGSMRNEIKQLKKLRKAEAAAVLAVGAAFIGVIAWFFAIFLYLHVLFFASLGSGR